MFDAFMISNFEPNYLANFKRLKELIPHAKNINGIQGIAEAHKEAAKAAKTEFLFIIDGDNEVILNNEDTYYDDNFWWFKFTPADRTPTTYFWKSYNPIINFRYGHGGIKLIHRDSMLKFNSTDRIDITTSIADCNVIFDQTCSIHRFDTSPFNMWKTAFRECVKLSSRIIQNQDDKETDELLELWTNKLANRLTYRIGLIDEDEYQNILQELPCDISTNNYLDFGNELKKPSMYVSDISETLRGALEGKTYGLINKNNLTNLAKINDIQWLKDAYQYGI